LIVSFNCQSLVKNKAMNVKNPDNKSIIKKHISIIEYLIVNIGNLLCTSPPNVNFANNKHIYLQHLYRIDP
jgi:hypothetical protein